MQRRSPGEEGRDGSRVRVCRSTRDEGSEGRADQEAVEWARHAAHRVLQEPESLGDLRVPSDGEAENRVAVAGKVLGGGVEDDVGAESSGRCSAGDANVLSTTSSGRVGRIAVPLADGARRGGDVDHLEERVRRVSNHTRRVLSVIASQSASAVPREVDVPGIDAVRRGGPARGSGRAAVDVVADDDLVPAAASSAIAAVAAEPDANAIPSPPPSSAATARCRRSRVGFGGPRVVVPAPGSVRRRPARRCSSGRSAGPRRPFPRPALLRRGRPASRRRDLDRGRRGAWAASRHPGRAVGRLADEQPPEVRSGGARGTPAGRAW